MKVLRVNYDGRNELLIAAKTLKEAQSKLGLCDTVWRRLRRQQYVIEISPRLADYQYAIENTGQALWASMSRAPGEDKQWHPYSKLIEVGEM